MTSSGSFQLTSNRKKYFNGFYQCFRQFLDKALQKQEKIYSRTISELPITENRIEKLLLVRFLLSCLFSQIVANDCFFLSHIALSQPVLKIMS